MGTGWFSLLHLNVLFQGISDYPVLFDDFYVQFAFHFMPYKIQCYNVGIKGRDTCIYSFCGGFSFFVMLRYNNRSTKLSGLHLSQVF